MQEQYCPHCEHFYRPPTEEYLKKAEQQKKIDELLGYLREYANQMMVSLAYNAVIRNQTISQIRIEAQTLDRDTKMPGEMLQCSMDLGWSRF